MAGLPSFPWFPSKRRPVHTYGTGRGYGTEYTHPRSSLELWSKFRGGHHSPRTTNSCKPNPSLPSFLLFSNTAILVLLFALSQHGGPPLVPTKIYIITLHSRRPCHDRFSTCSSLHRVPLLRPRLLHCRSVRRERPDTLLAMSAASSPPPPGSPQDNQGPGLAAGIAVLHAITIPLVLTRLYTRAFPRSRLGWDDFFIFIALVSDQFSHLLTTP